MLMAVTPNGILARLRLGLRWSEFGRIPRETLAGEHSEVGVF